MLRETLRTSLWFIPSLCVASAVGLAYLTTYLDERELELFFAFGGGAEGARGMLSAIASSMIGLTGIVFSVTIVVLQLASQQFSPRVLRTFLRDRHSQLALGVFIATFTYALLVQREVRADGDNGDGFVPGLSIAVAFSLVMLSLGFFVHYINHIAQSIRIATITRSIGDETRASIRHLFEAGSKASSAELPDGPEVTTIAAPTRGVLTAVDVSELVGTATRCDLVVEICPTLGDFVAEGAPVMKVYGPAGDAIEPLLDAVGLGPERTMQQDPAFGFRQLVDIGERALSSGVNDPTTAVQCIDQLHDMLRRMAGTEFPSGRWVDESGSLRLVLSLTPWEGYVELACDEIRHYGRDSVQIHRRLRAMLEDLLTVAILPHRHALQRQLALLDASAEGLEEGETAPAREPDASGLN